MRRWTAAQQRRVERAFEARGLLLVQGQAEVPSIADLLAGEPVTTKGYSWDYVPAWELAWVLGTRADVAECKLLRGRRTLVDRRLWPAVHALACAARPNVDSRLLDVVESRPGASGEECRAVLAIDARAFQREKGRLEQWLCVWGVERDDVEYHTHDRAWHPWATSKIARGVKKKAPPVDAACATLEEAIASDVALAKLLPVLKKVS